MWLTNAYVGKYFNPFVRSQIKGDILKRVIINGRTGSSWLPVTNKLQIIVTNKGSLPNLFPSLCYFSGKIKKKKKFIHCEASEDSTIFMVMLII